MKETKSLVQHFLLSFRTSVAFPPPPPELLEKISSYTADETLQSEISILQHKCRSRVVVQSETIFACASIHARCDTSIHDYWTWCLSHQEVYAAGGYYLTGDSWLHPKTFASGEEDAVLKEVEENRSGKDLTLIQFGFETDLPDTLQKICRTYWTLPNAVLFNSYFREKNKLDAAFILKSKERCDNIRVVTADAVYEVGEARSLDNLHSQLRNTLSKIVLPSGATVSEPLEAPCAQQQEQFEQKLYWQYQQWFAMHGMPYLDKWVLIQVWW